MRIERVALSTEAKTLAPVDLSSLDDILGNVKRGSLIPILQKAQEIYGYVPSEAIKYIATKTGISASEIYGVITFYAQFRLKPTGKHIIKICHGTACHVQNVKAVTESIKDMLKISDGETTDDGLFTMETVACLGCCSLAPVMMIGEETYGNLTGKDAVKVIREIKRSEK